MKTVGLCPGLHGCRAHCDLYFLFDEDNLSRSIIQDPDPPLFSLCTVANMTDLPWQTYLAT
jgi:hypothetical protein